MRRAIHTLRMRAGFLRKVPRGPSLDSQLADETEIQEHDDAADLLEALASPPETVEELRERAAKLMRCDDEIVDDVYGPIHIKIPESMDEIRVDVRDTGKAIRAAWFAIVGMMEVGRGD